MAPGSSRDAVGGGATTTPFDCDAPGVDRFHFEGQVSVQKRPSCDAILYSNAKH
jgi:hypothetical protein